VVASKPLLATALIALVWTAAALADNPTVRISSTDQAKAVAALLDKADFPVGWRGGTTKPSSISSPSCPGFDPKESDLVVTGHADAKFTFPQGGVELDQDVQVLESIAAVQTDFARTISPKLGQCLAYQLDKSANVVHATVKSLAFPATGTVSAAYRAVVDVRGSGRRVRLLSDFIFFGEGRIEYSFNVVAPVGAEDQLVQFESNLAGILLKRAGAGPA
jgi:hypothetical protein